MLSISEIFGDFHLQQYAQTNDTIPLSFGLVGYAAVIYFLIKSLRQRNILFVNLQWDAVSALIETLAAMLLLGQRFTNIQEWIGAGLIILGLYFIKFVPE